MQEVSLTTHKVCYPRQEDSRLHVAPSVRHLDLKTRIDVLLKNLDMPAFPQLETLRLRAWKHTIHPYDSIDLDLKGVQSLRHLYIENWSPKSISVTESCRVYAMWQYLQAQYPTELDWLISPCWSTPGTALTSLTFDAPRMSGDLAMYAVHEIVECQAGLKHLRIKVRATLGCKEEPLTFPALCNDGLEAPLRVEISTGAGCWLHVDEDTPSGRALVLRIKGPIYVGTPDAEDVLHWYTLRSRLASKVEKGHMSLWWQPAEAQSSAKSTVILIDRDVGRHAGDLYTNVICGSFSKLLCKFHAQIPLLVLVSLCMGAWLWLLCKGRHHQGIACRGSGLFESCPEVRVAGKAAFYRILSSWKSMEVSEVVDLLLEVVDFCSESIRPTV